MVGKEISGYDHFQYCGRQEVRLPPQQPPPTGKATEESLPVIGQAEKDNPKAKERTRLCPRCRQKCLKVNNNNHLKCWNCKTPFCYQCGKVIKGTVTMHFATSSSCSQHSDE